MFLICSLFQTMIINGTGRKKCNNSGIKTIEVSIESNPIQSIGIYCLFPGTSLVYLRDFSKLESPQKPPKARFGSTKWGHPTPGHLLGV